MADEKTLLTGVLTKTLNMTEEEVTGLLYQKAEDSDDLILNEDALNSILDKDVQRIDNVKNNVKPDKDRLANEYGRGAKETMEKFEKELKLKFGVESDTKGLDLVQATVDTVSECNTEITNEKVKAHPLYRALEENSVPKEKYDTKSQELEEFKSNQDRISRFGRVQSDAMSIMTGMKPIISDNAKVAKTRQEDFLQKFESYDYEIKDDGKHFVMKDGKRIEDDHGNAIKFPEHVTTIAETCYEFQVGQQAGQAGNQNLPSEGSQHINIPKTKEEYLKRMDELMKTGDRAGRIALKKAWDASQN